jgi:hypothetical protein
LGTTGISRSPGKAIAINRIPLLIALPACVALFLPALYNPCTWNKCWGKKVCHETIVKAQMIWILLATNSDIIKEAG